MMKLKILIAVPILLVMLIISCQKFDLVRIAAVETLEPTNISSTSVRAEGSIIDLGEDEKVSEYGFCLSELDHPTTNDTTRFYSENTSKTGEYSIEIPSLADGTKYYLRAYIITRSDDVVYGDVISFQTLSSSGGEWLHYDSGNNDDNGVGLTDGGTFDIAIRFPTQALTPYNGFNVTKIKFFPRAPEPSYYITLWEGTNPPTLLDYEQVYPTIDQWNEFIPSYTYTISSSEEFWAGIWIVDHSLGTHPAGVDEGPAVTGAGDMISFDNGESWEALSISNPALDYNWNLQVYVSNQKGEEIQMVNEYLLDTKEKKVSIPNNSNKVTSAEMNK